MNKATIHPPLAASAWPVVRDWAALDDLCIGVFDCPHTTPELTDDGPFVVRSQDVRSGVFRLEEAGHVSEATYRERIARAEPTFGDILYSREGTYFGNAAEVPAGVQVCLGQRMVLIKPRRDVIDSRFLTFWLNSPILKEHILGFRDGSVAERLNMPTIRNIPVPLIPMSEQKRLGEILGAFDDKIELNRRMNVTLEAMAQAIFRDWFVDFGPVRRKRAGEADPVAVMGGLIGEPVRATELATLFPVAFTADKLPERWSKSTLGQEFDVKIGRTPPRKEEEHFLGANIGVPWCSIRDLAGGEVFIAATSESLRPDSVVTFRVPKLPELTVLVSFKLTVGRVAISDVEMTTNEAIAHMMRRADSPSVWFTFCHLRQFDYGTLGSTSSIATAVNSASIRAVPITRADSAVHEAFDFIVGPIFSRLRAAARENRTLAETRDYLLPRLMSGAVRVGDVTQQEAAA